MSTDKSSTIDRYFAERLGLDDDATANALRASTDAGLPEIQITAVQGAQLMLIAKAIGATRVLELGTLGGFSTIWLARGVGADGRVISLEVDATHAEVARANAEHAGVGERIDIRVGAALDLLPELESSAAGPFDVVFIDADKENIPAYFDWAVRLSRPGSVIIVDNVVRGGAIVDDDASDPSTLGVKRLFELLASDTRVEATAMQTVGEKGHDGYLMALVLDSAD